MNLSFSGSIYYIFLFAEIISSVYGQGQSYCSQECQNDLPKWYLYWKSPTYLLEFPNPKEVTIDYELPDLDKIKEETYNAEGASMIIDLIEKHLKASKEKNKPDFVIQKLDPIEYEIDKVKMVLILRNLSFWNLDTYKKEDVTYDRKGHREVGEYTLTEDMLKYLTAEKDKESKHFFKLNHETGTYVREDIVWTIKVSTTFQSRNVIEKEKSKSSETSHRQETEKPIVIKAEFKIQPRDDEGNELDNEESLYASGIVTLHVYDFQFQMTLIVRHIQKCLVNILPEKKKCENRVPDFDLKYGMQQLKIHDIELTNFEHEDIPRPIEENPLDEVNDNVEKRKEPVDKSVEKEVPEKSSIIIINNELKDRVKRHLEILRSEIERDPAGMIRKRLCVNLMPKMTWKIMQMNSKGQLPNLIHEIVEYNDDFKRKALLSPAPSINAKQLLKGSAAAIKACAGLVKCKLGFGLFGDKKK